MSELNKYTLFENGIFVDQMTPREDIIDLIQELRPVKTQFELIRLGAEFDGGYLLPDDLSEIEVCFSPGVDVNASFEIDIKTKYGIESHLADYSVDLPPMEFKPKSFIKKFIGPVNNNEYITLSTWIQKSEELKAKKDLLLQMDIEGGEYLSILSTPDEIINNFRIIVIEIHNIEDWGHKNYFGVVKNFFNKLTKNFWIVHNHPNNCCGLVNLGGVIAPRVFELTLLRKDRGVFAGYVDRFPHLLDRPNLKERPDLVLPMGWRSL